MGKLKYIKGNLFETKCSIICHGVNILGKFGSGVAGQIAKRYPQVRDAYLEKFEERDWKLGQTQFVSINEPGNPNWVVNMATQATYGRTGKHVDYAAVRQCFTTLFRHCVYSKDKIAMPRIGAGLGGGEWKKIEEILTELLVHYNLEVSVYTK